jgi:transmembrane sensor
MATGTRIDSKLAEEAAAWVARFYSSPSEEDSGEFVEWLCRSPNHIEEFLVAKLTVSLFQKLDPQRQIDVDALIASASSRVVALRDVLRDDDANIAVQDPNRCTDGAPAAAGTHARSRRLTGRRAAIAAAVVAALAIPLLWFAQRSASTYSTGVGEQRTIHLADGSYIELNTRSTIRIKLTRDIRSVQLVDGEALFKVAHEPRRPFRVSTTSAMIQAVGTQFDVYRADSTDTRVTVVEGRVQVEAEAGETPGGALSKLPWVARSHGSVQELTVPLMLAAGEQASVNGPGRIVKNTRPDVSTAVAWRNGRLLFHDASLADVIREFSRYNDFRFQLVGDTLLQRKISGVFHSDDPQTLVSLFESDASVEVTHVEDGVVVKMR